MEQITVLQAPADPPSFHLWYAYATKAVPALNQAIGGLLESQPNIPIDQLDGIYDQWLSPVAV